MVQIRRGNRDNLEIMFLNPITLRNDKTLWSVGLSECNGVHFL